MILLIDAEYGSLGVVVALRQEGLLELLLIFLGVSLPEIKIGGFGLFGLDAVVELLEEGREDLVGQSVDLLAEHHSLVVVLGIK